MVWFLENLTDLPFTRVLRRARLGGAVHWEMETDQASLALARLTNLPRTGQPILGKLIASDNTVFSQPTKGLLLTGTRHSGLPNEHLVLTATETFHPTEEEGPRRRVWSRKPGQQDGEFLNKVTKELHGSVCVGFQDFLNSHVGARVPQVIQDGLTDLEMLAFLAAELTRDSFLRADKDEGASPHVVLLTGQSSTWQLAAFGYQQNERHNDAGDATDWMLSGFSIWTPGRFARLAAGAPPVMKLSSRLLGFDAASWGTLRESLALPFHCRHGWVVACVDEFSHNGAHQRWISTTPAVERLARPLASVKPRGTLYRARTMKYLADSWFVPCKLNGFKGEAIHALLTSVCTGPSGDSGMHFAPPENQPALVHVPDRLGEPAILVDMLRPHEGGGNQDDIRSLGPAALDLPEGLIARTKKDLKINTGGDILLERSGGRKVKIGEQYVDME